VKQIVESKSKLTRKN